MGIAPTGLGERSKWKVSSANLVPLQPQLHEHLTDGRSRAAILRPTRTDLFKLVQVLEAALQEESVQSSQQPWQPRWEEVLQAAWPRKQTVETMCILEYEYQIDFFDLQPDNVMNVKAPALFRVLTEEPGQRTYPNTMQYGLETFKAPLCVMSVIAVVVSQMSYVSEITGRRYQRTFLEDLDVMSYVINVLGSSTPQSFRTMNRPSVLPPLPPLDRSSEASTRLRQWPNVDAAGPIDPISSLPLFSSSPPEGYRENLAVPLYRMEADDMPASEEEGLAASADRRNHEKDSDGSADASSMGQRRLGGSRSDRLSFSMGTSSRLSRSVVTESDMTEADLHARTSALQLGGKAADGSEEEAQKERPSSEERDENDIEAPVGTLWHLQYQTLEDEQNALLDAAVSALAGQLQATAQARSNQATGPTDAGGLLFKFLVSVEPLPGVAPELRSIEQRRERMLRQWERMMDRPEGRQWLEAQEAMMQ